MKLPNFQTTKILGRFTLNQFFLGIACIILTVPFVYSYFIENVPYWDFLFFYHGPQEFFLGHFSNVYSVEYWESASGFFNYFPSSFLILGWFGLFEFNTSLWIWRFFNLTLAYLSLFLLQKIFKIIFKDDLKANIGILLVGIAIANFYEFQYSQRDYLALFLLVLSIYYKEFKNPNFKDIINKKKSKNEINHLSSENKEYLVEPIIEKSIHIKFNWISAIFFNLFVAIHPYYLFFYIPFILNIEKTWRNRIYHCLIVIFLNFPMLFLWRDYIHVVITLKSGNVIDLVSYSVFGAFYSLFSTEYSQVLIVSNLLIIGTTCIVTIINHYKMKNLSFIDIFIQYCFIQLLFNIIMEDFHPIIYLPFLIIYSFRNIKNLGFNLNSIKNFLSVFLIAIPIPSGILQIFFGELRHLKRAIGYIFFIKKPDFLKKTIPKST